MGWAQKELWNLSAEQLTPLWTVVGLDTDKQNPWWWCLSRCKGRGQLPNSESLKRLLLHSDDYGFRRRKWAEFQVALPYYPSTRDWWTGGWLAGMGKNGVKDKQGWPNAEVWISHKAAPGTGCSVIPPLHPLPRPLFCQLVLSICPGCGSMPELRAGWEGGGRCQILPVCPFNTISLTLWGLPSQCGSVGPGSAEFFL